MKVPVLAEASKLPLDNVKPEAAGTSPESKGAAHIMDKFWPSDAAKICKGNVVLWDVGEWHQSMITKPKESCIISATGKTLPQWYIQERRLRALRTLIVYQVYRLKLCYRPVSPKILSVSEPGHWGKWHRCRFEKFRYWQRHRSFHPKAWSHRQPSGWPPPAAMMLRPKWSRRSYALIVMI